jgi:hypothetical protein
MDLKNKIVICVAVILFYNNTAKSQNMLGYTSNYAGVIGTFLNPSSISNSKLSLDVNIFTAGGNLQTNYYFIPRDVYKPLSPFKDGFASFKAYQGYITNNKHNYLYAKEQLHLPSVMYSDGKKAFGFHISWRFEGDTKNAPNDIVTCLYDGMFYGRGTTQVLNVDKHADKFHFAVASWQELGATYSKTIKNDGTSYLAAGMTGNLLLGNAAFYYNNKKVDYYFEDTTSITFKDMHSDFGGVKPSGIINGLGMGVNLGITYCIGDSAENTGNNNSYYHYKYKFGASLLDVGGIRFGKGKTYRINSYDGENPDLLSDQLGDLDNLDEQVDGTGIKDHLNFYLPTALCFQFDYNVNNKVFVGANYIQGIHFTGCQIRRPTILSVCPRYEKRWFEVSLPLSLYAWRLPRIGFEMRAWNITVGAEKIGWLFKFNDYNGVDGYISFRYNICKKTVNTSNPLY